MNLIQAFEQNSVDGFDNQADGSIETMLSKLFFFGDKVVKAYKWKKTFFGDFENKDFRQNYYEEDFCWNQKMAPEIYLELRSVKKIGQKYVNANKEADDYYILMQRIDNKKNLTNLLTEKLVTNKNLNDIISVMATRLKELNAQKREGLNPVFKIGWLKLQEEGFNDLRQWAYMAESYIARKRTDAIVDALEQAASKEKYFLNHDTFCLSVAIDANCDNILILNNKIGFLDILPPKENWRVADKFFTICRVATDVAALLGREKANIMYEAYKNFTELPSENVKAIYEIRSALIQAAYRYALNQPSLAQKYLQFIEQRLRDLKYFKE